MINVLENAGTVAQRMMKWELFSLKERWLGSELTEIFKLPMGYYKIKLEDEFEIFWQTRNKGGRIKHTLNKWPHRSLGYTNWLHEMPTSGNCGTGFVLQRVCTQGLWTAWHTWSELKAQSVTASAANSLLGSEIAQSRPYPCRVGLPASFHTCIVAKCLDPRWTSPCQQDWFMW